MRGLMSLMAEMDSQIREVRHDVQTSLKLGMIVEGRTNSFPPHFVVLPVGAREMLGEGRSLAAQLCNGARRLILDPFWKSLWSKSKLYFVCPVTRKFVACGPEGKGYKFSVPTALLRTIAPALKWGFLLMKVALATQGLGAMVPDISGFLPDISEPYLDFITNQLDDSAMSTVQDW